MSEVQVPRNGSGGSESLCLTCAYSHVVQGFVESQQLIVCKCVYPPWKVAFAVRKCSGYANRCAPNVEEMREIAHVLVRGQRGKQVGFVTADQYRELEIEDED